MKKKIIKLTLTLQDGEVFIDSRDSNKISSKGLAVSASITQGNGAITPTAQVTVYGLPIETMNKLFRVQWNTMQAVLNTIKIEVGEEGGDLSTAYEGNITFATVNMDSAPDVSLVITSQMAIVEKMRLVPPIEIEKDESRDVADILEKLCTENGFTFENNGVSHIITSTTLNGSVVDIAQTLANWCEFDLYIEQRSITICPKGEPRPFKIPILSPTTGLINYPAPDIRGVILSCMYDPIIRFGGIITIKDSLIEVANADWRIYGLVSVLEANIPQGKWQQNINATWRNSKDAAVQR